MESSHVIPMPSIVKHMDTPLCSINYIFKCKIQQERVERERRRRRKGSFSSDMIVKVITRGITWHRSANHVENWVAGGSWGL